MSGSGHRSPLGGSFWTLWSATTVSSLGDGLALAALPLLAASLTHNALLVASVVTIETLPWLLVGVFTGTLVDRVDPARAMAAANVGSAAAMAAVTLLLLEGHLSIALLYLLAFLLGVFETVYGAAAQAAIPQLVGAKEELARANGLLLASETTGGHLAGPAAGGVVFAVGRLLPFAADCISFIGSAGMLIGLRGRFQAADRRARASFAAEMRAGVEFFANSPLLRTLALLTAGLAFFQAMVLAPLVLYVLSDLHLSQAGYGYFMGIAAIGNVAGSLVASRLRRRMSTATILTSAGLLAALAYLTMGATSSWPVSQAAFTVEALAVASGTVASVSLRQQHIPRELMGRVSNVFRTAIWGAVPLGAVLGGVLASEAGLRAPLFVAAAAQSVLVLGTLVPLRLHVRRAEASADAGAPASGRRVPAHRRTARRSPVRARAAILAALPVAHPEAAHNGSSATNGSSANGSVATNGSAHRANGSAATNGSAAANGSPATNGSVARESGAANGSGVPGLTAAVEGSSLPPPAPAGPAG